MPLDRETVVALNRAAALVNTGVGVEQLSDTAALDAFVSSLWLTGELRRADVELSTLRDLRQTLRQIWKADEDNLVELVNELLLDTRPLLELTRSNGSQYILRPIASGVTLAVSIAFEAAMAIADVLRAGERSRLRICEYPGCGRVGVDQSRNRSRRFCEGNCGNRASVAAYRLRKAQGGMLETCGSEISG